MIDCLIKKLPHNLSSYAGLPFFGKYLKRNDLDAVVDPDFLVCAGVPCSDMLKSYPGLRVWERTTLTRLRTLGATLSSFAPCACALFLLVLPCAGI
jgi:hypothetical protein